MPHVDFNIVQDSGFAPLPQGRYLVRVAKCTKKYTKNQEEQWGIELEVLDGPEHDPDAAILGRKIFDNVTWSQAGLPRCKLVLARLGIDTEVEGGCDWLPEWLERRVAVVETTISEWNGRKQTKIPFDGYHPDSEWRVVRSAAPASSPAAAKIVQGVFTGQHAAATADQSSAALPGVEDEAIPF